MHKARSQGSNTYEIHYYLPKYVARSRLEEDGLTLWMVYVLKYHAIPKYHASKHYARSMGSPFFTLTDLGSQSWSSDTAQRQH